MPTATVSSVKHPDGIYQTADSGRALIPVPPSSFLLLGVFVSFCLHHLRPPTFPKLLPTPLPPPLLSRHRRRLVQDVCLINEDPKRCCTRIWSAQGAKSPPLIVQLQRTDKRPWSLILLKVDYWPVCILLRCFFYFLSHFIPVAVVLWPNLLNGSFSTLSIFVTNGTKELSVALVKWTVRRCVDPLGGK